MAYEPRAVNIRYQPDGAESKWPFHSEAAFIKKLKEEALPFYRAYCQNEHLKIKAYYFDKTYENEEGKVKGSKGWMLSFTDRGFPETIFMTTSGKEMNMSLNKHKRPAEVAGGESTSDAAMQLQISAMVAKALSTALGGIVGQKVQAAKQAKVEELPDEEEEPSEILPDLGLPAEFLGEQVEAVASSGDKRVLSLVEEDLPAKKKRRNK